MKASQGRQRRPAPALKGLAPVLPALTGMTVSSGAMAADAAAGATGAAALAQAGLGLFAVIALILGLAWVARRTGLVRHATGGAMKVIGSTTLGARQRLLLVEVGDSVLVLGVSAGEIRTLHTLPAGSIARDSAPSHGGPTPPDLGTGSFAQKLLRSMQHNLKS
ncbi:flagellar biosynthetic protein FliO [Cupriavidus sp. AU9028]|uniref:flagellar biosynthetic protein FliO n=1 Tax=Cupriavidus sp. AU9028 TaxID=2871157 RepID=UPI00351CF494